VGGLGPGATASDLSQLFIRCGEIEGVSRDPGRTFAFVTFVREQDAVAAARELQGARVRGAPVRIEFSKGVSVELPPVSTTVRRTFFELFMFMSVCFVSEVSLMQCASLILCVIMNFRSSITKSQESIQTLCKQLKSG
jgi:RNA recognition motif-containing protein